jgi:NAD(P)-dependent dehydrogenase (short-subunit alcohol dehydrogenase family)
MSDFKGKHVLVTGSNKGIGLGLCTAFKAAGAHVYAVCRKESDELKKLGVKVYNGVESTDEKSIDALAAQLTKDNVKLDLLVNNAGQFAWDSVEKMDFNNMRKQFDINAVGPLATSIALFKAGRLADKARVAFISSIMGSITDPLLSYGMTGFYAYKMAKAALNMAVVNLAHEWKSKGIVVVTYHPGVVWTDANKNSGVVKEEHALPVDKACGFLLTEFGKMSIDNTGKFINAPTGQPLPW